MLEKVNSVGMMNAIEANASIKQLLPATNALYSSRISSEKDESGYCGIIFGKIGGVFTWIWGKIKSIFQTIFRCVDYSSSVDGKVNIQEFVELKNTLTSLRTQFISESKKNRATVSDWWKQEFDNLSERGQSLIVKKHIEDWASHKFSDEESNKDQIAQYVEGMYKNGEKKEKALLFVKNLDIVGDDEPQDPRVYLPAYLNQIIADLTSQIDEMGGEKEKQTE